MQGGGVLHSAKGVLVNFSGSKHNARHAPGQYFSLLLLEQPELLYKNISVWESLPVALI